MVGLEPTTSCLQDKRSAIETTSALLKHDAKVNIIFQSCKQMIIYLCFVNYLIHNLIIK